MDKEKNPRLAEKALASILMICLALILPIVGLFALFIFFAAMWSGESSGGGIRVLFITFCGLFIIALIFGLSIWLIVRLLKGDKNQNKTVLNVAWQKRLLVIVSLMVIVLLIVFILSPVFSYLKSVGLLGK